MPISAEGHRGLVSGLKLVIRHASQGFSFILAPHGTGTTVTFNVPGRVASALLVLVILCVGGIAFVGVTYTKLAILALETKKLEAENASLRQENERIVEFEKELVHIDNIRRQIEAWAGAVPGRARVTDVLTGDAVDSEAWPRKYTYAIMRSFYAERPAYPHGMMAPATGWISRGFIGDAGTGSKHPGIDVAASAGTPVRCALAGIVSSAGWDDIYGNVIVVQHSDSLSTVYGHNEQILVKEGDHVTKGQVIATIGSTGRSTAPHLHFEVLKDGMPVDPELYVRFTKN